MLKSTYMVEEYEKERRKQLTRQRSLMDYVLGILICFAGIFFLIRNKFILEFNERFPPNDMDKVFGAICILYGGWRIYRGYKKNYFKKEDQ